MKLKALHGITLAALLGFSSAASAGFFNITGDVPFSINGFDLTIETSGTDVIDVSGLFDSKNITGLITTPFNLTTNQFSGAANYDFAFTVAPVFASGADGVNIYTTDNFDVGFSGTDTFSFGGDLSNVSVSAVPEPATYAMFLAGLGLLGFARRAKQA